MDDASGGTDCRKATCISAASSSASVRYEIRISKHVKCIGANSGSAQLVGANVQLHGHKQQAFTQVSRLLHHHCFYIVLVYIYGLLYSC